MKMPPEADGTVGLDEKAAEGGYPRVAPMGYQNVDDDIGITPHLNKDTVCDTILRNPAYYGTFRWGGKTYDGNYEPLITKDLYDRVQLAVDRRSRAKTRRHTFTYTGLLTCGTCNGLLIGDIKKQRYVYYRCAGTKGCRRHYPERTFETHTLALLEFLRIDEETSTWLLHELDTQDTTAKNEEHAARLKKRLTELDRLAASAYEEKLLGTIDQDFWQERTTAWQHERDELRAELSRNEQVIPHEEFLAAARHPIELPPTRPGSVRYARTQRKGRTPQNPRVELHGHGRKSHRDTTFALRPPHPRREKQGLVELNGIEPSTS
jgi:recombinase